MVELTTKLDGVAVADAPEVIRRMASCLDVAPVPASAGKLLVVHLESNEPSFLRRYGIAVWQYDGAWKTASLLTDEAGNGLLIERFQETTAGFDVITRFLVDGTGFIGGFRFYRFGPDMRLLWDGQAHGHFTGEILDDDLLLGTYRERSVLEEPHYYAANCCYPTNGQTLWQRRGDEFVEKAVRTYPSLLRTASAFAGAWNRGMLDLAGAWTANPQVLPDMLGGMAKPPTIRLNDQPPGLTDIEASEAAYWDALPAEYRGAVPTTTDFTWSATPRPLVLKRIDGNWKVLGWKLDK